jgi:hypothetical protein
MLLDAASRILRAAVGDRAHISTRPRVCSMSAGSIAPRAWVSASLRRSNARSEAPAMCASLPASSRRRARCSGSVQARRGTPRLALTDAETRSERRHW